MRTKRTSPRLSVRMALALAALILIAIGLAGREAEIVLSKAVRLCLECIGIG